MKLSVQEKMLKLAGSRMALFIFWLLIIARGAYILYVRFPYARLWRYVNEELALKYLSERERRSMLFHAATFHIRVLKHRVYINPDNVLKFYAVGVKTLNEFLEQYE